MAATVRITAPIGRTSQNATYPTHNFIDGKVPFVLVADLADFNASITSLCRTSGMLALYDDGTWWQLQSDLTTLTAYTFPSTGGGSPTGAAGGRLAGNYPNPTLANTAVSSGNYGTTPAKTVSFTVGADGTISAASQQDILIALSAVSGLISALAATEKTANKGQPNGYVPLTAGSLIDPMYYVSTGLLPKGNWNGTTNTPTISDGTGSLGFWYVCNVAGSQDLGHGSVTYNVGDWLIHNGTQYIQNGNGAPSFITINGITNTVFTLTTNNIADFNGKRYIVEAVKDALAATQAGPFPAGATNAIATDASVANAVLSIVVGATQLTPETFNDGLNTSGDGTLKLMNTIINPSTGVNYTTGSALAKYPLCTTFNAATASYDDYLEQTMFFTMEQGSGSSRGTYSGGRAYVHGVGRQLPRTKSVASYSNNPLSFQIDGNECSHRNGTGTPMVHYSRLPANQAQAETDPANYIQYSVKMKDMTLHGITGDTGIVLGASYQPLFEGMKILNMTYGLKAYFCLHGVVKGCTFGDSINTGLLIATGLGDNGVAVWSGASLSNSASNGFSVIDGNKFRCANNATAGLAAYGCDQITINGAAQVFEGAGTPVNHVLIDTQGSSLVNQCIISNLHLEQEVTRSWIRIKSHSQGIQANINNISPFILNTSNLALVEAETSPTNGVNNGSIEMDLSYMPSRATAWIMRRSGFGYTFWNWDLTKLPNQTSLTAPENWNVANIGGVVGNIPAGSFLNLLRITN
jgi:hypothetical protein